MNSLTLENLSKTVDNLVKDIETMKLKHSALALKYYKLKKHYKSATSELYGISKKQQEMEMILYAEEKNNDILEEDE